MSVTHTKLKPNAAVFFAWGLCALCGIGTGFNFITGLTSLTASPSLFELTDVFGWHLVVPVVFVGLTALVIAHQPGNRVGWLMLLIALGVSIPTQSFLAQLSAPPPT